MFVLSISGEISQSVEGQDWCGYAIWRFPKAAWRRAVGRPGHEEYSLPARLAHLTLQEIERTKCPYPQDANTLTPQELLHRAAERSLFARAEACGIDPFQVSGIFHDLLAISALRYERRETAARVILSANPPEPSVRFVTPVELGDHRAARRVLETARHDLPAIGTFEQLLGLADAPPATRDAIDVRFDGFHAWSVHSDGARLFSVVAGVPRLPRGRLDRDELASTIKFTFGDEANVTALVDVALAATEAGHGALLVICLDAANEVQRLASQATLLAPGPLSAAAVRAVTSIDGAVVLDTSGHCHAIGVILDGKLSTHGTRARGARYNSAVRYVQTRQRGQTIAIVVSEDGDVNIRIREDEY